MSKAELVAAVQKSLGKETSSSQADRTVDAVINGIKTGVKTKSVQLIGFGTFKNCHPESTQGRQSKDRGKDQDQGQQDGQIRAGSSIQENLVIG